MPNAIESLVKNLKTHLETISGLTVLGEFPAANQALTLPSLTITQGTPKFRAIPPYPIAVTTPNGSNQTTSDLAVGEYDLTMQLDLWCRSKSEREKFFGLLFAKLNPDISPMGLSLKLTDYFNLWARFDLDNHQFVDDEAGAQRQEWRVKLMLLANTQAVLSKTDYAMITFDTEFSTPDTI